MGLRRVKICDGTVVSEDGTVLRGGSAWVYAWGKQTGETDYNTNSEYYDGFRKAGLNAVRVVCFDAWQKSNGNPYWDITVKEEREEFLSELDRVVKAATDSDLNVMINYHDTGNFDLPNVKTFWEWVAPRYASSENVFYELVNEPVRWSPSDYTEQTVGDLHQLYRRVRVLAPKTHLVLLSIARIKSENSDCSAIDIAAQLTDVNWENASVGFHAYGCTSSDPIVEIKAVFPVLNTEVDLPRESGGSDESTSLDGETYVTQTMERLGIGWFAWHVDGLDNFRRYFEGGILKDARDKNFVWPTPKAVRGSSKNSSSIARFFTQFPVRKAAKIMGMKKAHYVILVGLSLSVALLDGTMLAMLIPITFGLAEGSYLFMSSWPGIHWLFSNWPILGENSTAMFLLLAAATFFVGLGKSVASYCLTVATAHYYGRYSMQMASYLFGRYLTFGKSYFDRNNPGKLATTIDHHHDLVNMFQSLLRGLTETFTLAAYFAVMLLISWRLTIIVILVAPILYIVGLGIAVKIKKPSERAHADTLRIAGQSYNVLTAIPLYQLFGKEKRASETYRSNAESLRKADFRVWLYQGLVAPVQEVSMLLALLSILGLAFVIEDGAAKQITVMFVFFFVARLALPRLSIFHEIELVFEQKLPRVRRVFEVFSDEGKYTVRGGSRTFEPLKTSIEFRHLAFSYPQNSPALHDISFTAEKGELTALVGPSGAGKTTITSLLVRLYDVPEDSILIDGIDIRDFSIASLRNQVAMVNQDIVLIDGSLRDNLEFGLEKCVSDDVMNEVLHDAGLLEMVNNLPLGLDTNLGDRGVALSGGERQRVAIARALLRKAPILILDEATSALDSKTERHVQSAIENAIKGCTSLVIAHRLSTIQRADKVVVVDGGRVVEKGTLRELLDKRGVFHAMWEAQQFD